MHFLGKIISTTLETYLRNSKKSSLRELFRIMRIIPTSVLKNLSF